MSSTDSANLQTIADLLQAHLNVHGFGAGFGLGIVTAGAWMLFGFLRNIYNDRDE